MLKESMYLHLILCNERNVNCTALIIVRLNIEYQTIEANIQINMVLQLLSFSMSTMLHSVYI